MRLLAAHDDGGLERAAGGAGKVVGVAAGLVAVDAADAARLARGEDLEQVQLAAAGRVAPAAARAVLLSARDERVEHPDGGHVGGTGGGVVRHGELEQEDFRGAAEAVVRDAARARVAAQAVRGARSVGEEDDFAARGQLHVAERLGRGG